MWARRQEVVCCSECSDSLPQRWGGGTWVHDVGGPWIHTDDSHEETCYGIQRHTCHECLKHYCWDCKIDTCSECYRVYCKDCSSLRYCQYRHCCKTFCSGCSAQKPGNCRGCNMLVCVEDRDSCYSCGVTYCEDCIAAHWGGDIIPYNCDQCERSSCADCSPVLRCAHNDDWPCVGQICSGCAEDLFPSAEPLCSDCGNFYCDRHMKFCSTCDDDGACCNNCRVNRTLEGGDSKRKRSITCDSCRSLLFPLLKERIEELTKDNNRLMGEIDAFLIRKGATGIDK